MSGSVTQTENADSPAVSHRGLLKSARLIGVLTLISRMLGLARDIAITNAFGVGSVSSAFWTAFQIPNLFRRLFGEGALSAASIPVLAESLAQQGHESADRLAGRIMGLLLVLLTIVCVAGEVVVAGLFWHYRSDSDTALVLALTALMLPYLIFICAAAILGGVQNVFNRFASAASAPIILNLFMIAAAVGGRWLLPGLRRQAVLLSAAVVVSGIFQLAWQWAAARRCRLRLPLSLEHRDPAIRRIGVTMLPMMAGLATVQLNTLAGSLMAWWFVPDAFARGSEVAEKVGPAILSLAQRLYQFPLAIFATALATAIFPALSRSASQRDMAGLSATLSRGLRVVSFEGIPCMIGLIAIREPLIRTLFGHGEFLKYGPQAVDRVALALAMYALGIWAFGINQLIVRAFYAVQDARTPMWVSLQNVALNLACNLVLVLTPMREAGLALSTTLCAVIQVAVLLRKFHARYTAIEWRRTGTSVLKTIAAALVMWAAVAVLDRAAAQAAPIARLGILVAGGAVSYLTAAWALRCEELREMLRRG